MTQLLKHKSVITCVLNTERRICFFWTLIMHWVTTPTPTSIVLIDYVGAVLAKNKPRARLPSPLPMLSSHKQIHKDISYGRSKNRSALQISLGSAWVSHQLWHSGCCTLVLLSPACLSCIVPLAPMVALCCSRPGYLADHTQHALKNLSNSGHKYLSDLTFHNYDPWTTKRALCVKWAWGKLNSEGLPNSSLRLRPSQLGLQGMSKPELRDLHVTGDGRHRGRGCSSSLPSRLHSKTHKS